jgi:hypothetical protein
MIKTYIYILWYIQTVVSEDRVTTMMRLASIPRSRSVFTRLDFYGAMGLKSTIRRYLSLGVSIAWYRVTIITFLVGRNQNKMIL